MEFILNHFVENMSQLIGILLMFIVLSFIAISVHLHRNQIWEAITGPDGKLSTTELIIAIWLILFPIVVLSSMFLDKTPDPAVVYTLDIILLVALGAKKFPDKDKESTECTPDK